MLLSNLCEPFVDIDVSLQMCCLGHVVHSEGNGDAEAGQIDWLSRRRKTGVKLLNY